MGNQRLIWRDNMPRYTFETFERRLHELFPTSDFSLLTWSNIKQPCSFICHTCGKIQEYQAADKIVDRHRRGLSLICKECEDTAQQKPRELGIQKVEYALHKKQTIVLLDPIVRLHKDVRWKCLKCNHIFPRQPVNFLKNQKCPWCEGEIRKHTIATIKERAIEVHGDEYTVLSEDYQGSSYEVSKILLRHNKCGFIYKASASSFLAGHGCPRCKSSAGEILVRKFLDKYNIPFIDQYRFSNSEVSSLVFDFFIENEKETFVIEYNGRQHYEPVDQFGGEPSFVLQQQRDARKKTFCEQQNIVFIEVPYTDHSILSKELAQRLLGEGSQD